VFEKDPHPIVEEAVNVEISRPKREDGSKDLVVQVIIKRKLIISDEQTETAAKKENDEG
jgi:hypothetical protein